MSNITKKNKIKLFMGKNLHICMHNYDLPNWEWFKLQLLEKKCKKCIVCLLENKNNNKQRENFFQNFKI
jgi:hypothetical protein